MKKVILVYLISFGLLSFKTFISNEYSITGTIEGIENGTLITLEKQDQTLGIISIDSAKVVDGKFSFKGTTSEPSIHFLQVKNTNGKVIFILEEGKIDVVVYKDSIAKSKIGGTKNNEYLLSFN